MRSNILAGFVILCGAVVIACVSLAAVAAQQPAATAAWPRPGDPNTLPGGAWKDAVLYGRQLVVETYSILGPEVRDSKLRYSGNNLSCQSCHLDGGTRQFALPLIGMTGVFPAYMARENEVRTLEDRINGCFERSMNGRALPVDSKEMKAILAYLQFISIGVPTGASLQGRGSPPLPLLQRSANSNRGSEVYRQNCAICHQTNGQGQRNGVAGDAKGYLYPPLWGSDSFNDGAGMHRLIASASFIRANMPFGVTHAAPALSVEDAWDVAAYINSQPRPHRENLDRDYPVRARKPVDAPFPPYADNFPADMHKFGPFQAPQEAQRKALEAGVVR